MGSSYFHRSDGSRHLFALELCMTAKSPMICWANHRKSSKARVEPRATQSTANSTKISWNVLKVAVAVPCNAAARDCVSPQAISEILAELSFSIRRWRNTSVKRVVLIWLYLSVWSLPSFVKTCLERPCFCGRAGQPVLAAVGDAISSATSLQLWDLAAIRKQPWEHMLWIEFIWQNPTRDMRHHHDKPRSCQRSQQKASYTQLHYMIYMSRVTRTHG